DSLNKEETEKLKSLLEKYKDRFAFDKSQLGRTKLCKVTINTNDKPPFNLPPYRLPLFMRHEVQRQIEQMKTLNVIRDSKSPYSSPVLLVKKKDGSWRLVVDLRRLNKDVESEVYPFPNVEDWVLANRD
ncbi:Retrovirus-related Pol polyprotein from transposon-like protein, partial [Dinothrombium tinctorium]